MITRFFDDVIFREEDVIFHQSCLPGDSVDLYLKVEDSVEVFVVRVGEKPLKEGDK